MKIKPLNFLLLAIIFTSCQSSDKKNQQQSMEKFDTGSFGYDLNFLKEKDSIIVLQNETGNAQVIVSPKYQGKVFTSTADGLKGNSFGWINYKAFKDELDPHMNGYGGEDRLWLGPEGGKYSIFFKPGTKMEFANWHTPAPFDSETWNLVSSTGKTVSLSKDMNLFNYAGATLKIKVNRDIEILENIAIEKALAIQLDETIKSVGFKTSNTLTNAGDSAWTHQTGAPCMWNLDMFTPSPKTVIVIPYQDKASGNVATTDYFGQIPPDRVKYSDGILYFKADGKARGKLGIPPPRAKTIAGSFDPQNNVLTITQFDIDNNGTYLNQEWTTDKDPLKGDAVNAYNDGPLADGGQLGPFYEIESVSPAAFLKPGKKLNHQHSVFHFTGDKTALDAIAQKVLGISLNKIEAAFNQ
ncbi:MAG TPA: DUF6786 family protein [Chitinophagaceae bacterium]|nr:DUF6786 family protein [Chitinophagaceae bacterium]